MSLLSLDALEEIESDINDALEKVNAAKAQMEPLQKLLEEAYNIIDSASDDLGSIADDLRNDYEGITPEPDKLDALKKELAELAKKLYDAY